MFKKIAVLSIGLLFGFNSSLKADFIYDAVKDFSASANPAGQWQYRYGTVTNSSLMTSKISNNGNALSGWVNDPNAAIPNQYVIEKNFSSTAQNFGTVVFPTDLLRLDGQGNNDIVRWTAPSAGNWSISGLFQGIDTGEHAHNVEILKNLSSVLLAPSPINAYGSLATFSMTQNLKAGDTIDFIELTGPSPYNLSTGLAAQISAVPEPTSLAMIGMGICGLLGYFCRRRLTGMSAN